jgi:hypothetical protein
MGWKSLFLGLLFIIAGATTSLAEAPTENSSGQRGGFLAVVRTIAYLPFKGVGCFVGTVVSFPVYWLSGFDANVKNDTQALRAKYCSSSYLFSSEWEK